MLQRSQKWAPKYFEIMKWRGLTLDDIRSNSKAFNGAGTVYRNDPVRFIDDWVDTYDPRNASNPNLLVRMPFILFPRQRELIQFFHQCLTSETNGLVEKSRDMGATWAALSYAVWLWIFKPGSSVGFGSRKAQLVDRIGDLDSIFEKLRKLVEGLPAEFVPLKFESAYMKLINHDNGASITGESGDEIGRGGRKLIYFKDESAHYEHPESIEAALSENTRVQIDISSVAGPGNVFHRKREGGIEWEPGLKTLQKNKTYVFVLDWRDHPEKTQQWYDERRQKFIDEGLLHIFKQEVDRDYAAAQEGVILQAEWIHAAIDAHKKIAGMQAGRYVAGLDVADGGGDRNALALRKGSLLESVEEWGERDTGRTARRCVERVGKFLPCDVMYDCVGVGSGVKAEINRLKDEKLIPKGVMFAAWDAGATANNPDDPVIKGDSASPLNKDHYANLKAQGWWELRKRFERTYYAVKEGAKYKPEQLISLSSELPLLRKLEKELLQPTSSLTSNMRLLVDKMPEGTRSPNLADAVMMAYHPVGVNRYASMSWV